VEMFHDTMMMVRRIDNGVDLHHDLMVLLGSFCGEVGRKHMICNCMSIFDLHLFSFDRIYPFEASKQASWQVNRIGDGRSKRHHANVLVNI